MSVILVTGQPGSGKTAHVVDLLAHDEQFNGRPIFVMGIPDLTLPVIQAPPVDQWVEYRQSPEDPNLELAYFTFPENSLVVLDEAQRVYRPRPVGSKVPGEVAAFETHRHLGIDFILISQHAGLIDSNIRKLVGRHIHIRVTALGRYRYEWTELGDPESHSSRELAAREKYVLPKRAFGLYKSSELHTKIKAKIPFFVWIFVVATIAAIALGGWAFYRVNQRTNPDSEIKALTTSTTPSVSGATVAAVLTQEDILVSRTPRIAGELHTAPRYDGLTAAVVVPELRGCIATSRSCGCVDQDGNSYPVERSRCLSYVRDGLPYQDWGTLPNERQQLRTASRESRQPVIPAAAPLGASAPVAGTGAKVPEAAQPSTNSPSTDGI